jgi:hypothetical protein
MPGEEDETGDDRPLWQRDLFAVFVAAIGSAIMYVVAGWIFRWWNAA